MCGGHCACSGETGCVLTRTDLAERRVLQLSFTPRPDAEPVEAVLPTLIGLP